MSREEAERMAVMLNNQCGGTPVTYHLNDIGQWVVKVEWSTGPVYFVSVRECVREATWLHGRGGPGGAWIKQ